MTITINGSAVPGLVTTSYGTTVTLACNDTTAAAVLWSVDGMSDSTTVAPTITPSGTPLGVSATFTFPAAPSHGRGLALRIKAQVLLTNGSQVTYSGVVGVPGPSGNVPITYQEQDERGTVGYADAINSAVANQVYAGSSVVTTTAAVTTLLTIPVGVDGIGQVRAQVWGITVAGATLQGDWRTGYTRVSTGQTTLTYGTAADAGVYKSSGAAAWVAQWTVSNNNLLLQVTGAAGVTIRWKYEVWREEWTRASL